MQVDFPCEFLDPCCCGGQPDHYTVGYGPRPYDVRCPKCHRQVTFYCDSVGGHHGNIIWLWNKIAPLTHKQAKALAKKQGERFTTEVYELDLGLDGKPHKKRTTSSHDGAGL